MGPKGGKSPQGKVCEVWSKTHNGNKTQRLIGQGYEGFLCNIVDTKIPEASLKNILVVQEFSNVFPDDI